jgi:uncharacterized membrane protein
MHRPIVLTLAVIVISLVHGMLHAQPAASLHRTAPKIEVVGGDVVDFGRVRAGEHKRTIAVTNVGNDTLRDLAVHSGCGCTVGMLDRTWLSPGDTTHLSITANATDYLGESWLKTIWLTSNDPTNSTIVITVKASFKHDARITSLINTIVRDSCPGGVCAWNVEVKNSGDSAVTINPPLVEEMRGTLVEFDMKEPARLAPGDSLKLAATVRITGGEEYPSAKAVISTSSSYDSELYVSFFYAPEKK